MPKLAVNGIELNYVDRGSGDVLLMVHNVAANITALEEAIRILEKRFRVIAFDLRGHGETTHEDDEAKAKAFYTFDNIAEDATQLLDHLGVDRFIAVGQAYWGVSSVAHIYARHADRIDGLVFASCDLLAAGDDAEPYSILGPKAVANFERMIALAREKGMMGVYEERLRSKTFWGPTVFARPDILESFAEMHRKTSPAAFANFPRFRRQTFEKVVGELRRRHTPLLMLMGAEDSHNDEMMRGMREQYPDTHIVILPYCGHYLAIENPADFTAAICNFVAGTKQSARTPVLEHAK